MGQDVQLKGMHVKVIRKRTLSVELSTLQVKRGELNVKVNELAKQKDAEQKDVDRLEKAGVTSFFYSVLGKKEEKLEKERAEAFEAMKQYEEAFLELDRVNRSIELKETELATLEGYEEKFEKLLQGKRRLLENTVAEIEILDAERELALQKEKYAVFTETQKLGEQILEYIGKIRETLDEAEKCAIAQSSPGMSLEIRKSELLSQAQKQVALLQPLLKDFGVKVEQTARGIEIHDNLSVVYEFGNGIYTSFIAAESVMSVVAIERIRTAKGNLILLREQIEHVQPILATEKESGAKKLLFLEEEVEKLIIEA